MGLIGMTDGRSWLGPFGTDLLIPRVLGTLLVSFGAIVYMVSRHKAKRDAGLASESSEFKER
jgi:hypothetical protein